MNSVKKYEIAASRRLKSFSCLGSGADWAKKALLLILGTQVLLPLAPQLQGQKLTPPPRAVKKNATNKFTGSDGSQTGTADFQGNFTSITADSGQALILFRESDCSLSLGTGSYNVSAGSYSQTGLTNDYERTIHTEAGLTTTPDVFAKKCLLAPPTGLNSTPFVFVGDTTKGVGVFATIGLGSSGNESLYIASGTTTFTLKNFSFAAAGVIATADLNGDGNGDLVITNTSLSGSGGAVTVMLGNDDGTFQTGVTYPTTGTGTDAVVIDDFNGDGKLDLAAVSDTAQQTQQISILLGKGDGTFNASQSFAAPTLAGYTTSTPASGLISGNFRNNGRKDLILSNGAVLLSNGDGTFAAAANPAFPYFATGSYTNLASGDINNDGNLDVVVSLGSTVSMYTGKGDGTFVPGNTYGTIGTTGYIAIDDLDGDGNQDIYIGLGDGGVYVGDSYDPNLTYALMGHGDGTFAGAPAIAPPSGRSQGLFGYNGTNLGDVNGDGYPDLIVPASSSAYNVLLGSSTGNFKIATPIQVPNSITLYGKTVTGATATSSTVVTDINGDGKADLVFVDNGLNPYLADGSNALNPLPVYFVALSNGDGTFQAPVAYPFPQIAPANDYDNNVTVNNAAAGITTSSGHVDFVLPFTAVIGGTSVANPYIAGMVTLTGNGDGTFSTTPVITTTSSSATAPTNLNAVNISALTDLNGDKKLDLLTLAPGGSASTGFNQSLQLLLGNGDGSFQQPSSPTVSDTSTLTSTYTVTVADLNKDNKPDLICLNETVSASQAQLAIALGNGDGTFQAPVLSNLSGGDIIRSSGLAAADFNADGNVDLALLRVPDISGIFYGNGDGTIQSIPLNGNIYPKDLINLAADGASIATDLNKDGKPDVLAGNIALVSAYGTAVVTPPASSTTTLKASAASVTAGTSVTFTATVAGGSGSSGTPTGTVTFYDGNTTLGTGKLSSGVATYATTTLAAGTHSVTAKYGGDANFASSTSSAVTVTVTAATPSFTLGASPMSLSIASAGASATTTLTVTPSGGFNQQVSFACSGLPSEASCSFSPATVTPGAAAATTTLTVSTTAAHAVKGSGNSRSGLGGVAAFLSAAMLILTFRPSRSRMRWLAVLLVLGAAGFGLSGCGGSGSSGGGNGGGGGGGGTTDPGTPTGTSNVTVTATAGSLTQTVSLSVNVQ